MSVNSFKKRTYVMNDDILGLVLCELPIKQLLRLENVSEQFRDCVNYALKRKAGIRLGKKFQNLRCWDKRHSVVGGNIRRAVKCRYNKYDLTYELDKSLDSLALILKKCPNIKALYLSECRINEEVIQLLVDNCKQLKCLTLAANFCTNDMDEWIGLTAVLAKLNLNHLSIVGQCYEYNILKNCSRIQEISPQINYLVSQLPELDHFMAYWYGDDLDNLINCLPPTLKSLHLIRCSKLSVQSLTLLNSGNFPYLKDLNIDLNFYGRTKETVVFNFICYNLNLKNLVFYSDDPIEDMDHLNYTSIKRLKLKVYEKSYFYKMSEQFMSLESLYLINYVLSPDNQSLHRAFPQLRDLTLKNYHFRCVCVDDCSDGESFLIFNNYKSECDLCNPKCIKKMSKLSNLKRLRLFHIRGPEVEAFKYFLHVPILELPGCWGFRRAGVTSALAEASIAICDSRRMNPFALPLTIRSDQTFIEKLEDKVIELNEGSLPTNLSLHIREYRSKRYLDY